MSTRRPASRLATPVPEETVSNGSNGPERNSVVLGPNDRLRGELYIEGDLRVVGTVDGNLEATGDIEIAGSGKVKGDVTAYRRLTVGGDASLVAGEVRVARLTVEDGATFSGRVTMGKVQPAAKAPEPAPKPEPMPEPVPEPVVALAEPEPVALAEPEIVAVEPVAVAAEPVKPVTAKPVTAKPVAAKSAPIKAAPAAKSTPAKPAPASQKGKRR